jgi:hypothetical protein
MNPAFKWIFGVVIFLVVLVLLIVLLTLMSCTIERRGCSDSAKNFEFQPAKFVSLDSSNYLPSPHPLATVSGVHKPIDDKYKKWNKINPSVTLDPTGKNLIVAYRLTRSYLGIHKRSMIGISILDFNLNCLSEFVFEEYPSRSLLFRGYEDPRVFVANGKVYATAVVATKLPLRAVPIAKLRLLELDLDSKKIKSDVPIVPDFEDILVHQKNWNPFFVDEEGATKLYFTQKIEPHTVVEVDFSSGVAKKVHSTSHQTLKILSREFKLHGGSNSIRFGTGEMLGVCHSKRTTGFGRNTYKSIFYTFSPQPPFNVKRVSREFSIPVDGEKNSIQMVTGLIDCETFSPDLAQFVLLTVGIMDTKMLGLLIGKKMVENMLAGDTSSKELTFHPFKSSGSELQKAEEAQELQEPQGTQGPQDQKDQEMSVITQDS